MKKFEKKRKLLVFFDRERSIFEIFASQPPVSRIYVWKILITANYLTAMKLAAYTPFCNLLWRRREGNEVKVNICPPPPPLALSLDQKFRGRLVQCLAHNSDSLSDNRADANFAEKAMCICISTVYSTSRRASCCSDKNQRSVAFG